MILKKYFNEIKNRFILICLSWLCTIVICYCYRQNILFLTLYFNDKIFADNYFYFTTTGITDLFTCYFKLSYMYTNILTLIYIIYNVIIFMSPGLYEYEYYRVKKYLYIILFLLISSWVLTNNYFLPILWEAFYTFQYKYNNVHIFFEAKLLEYVKFYVYINYLSINMYSIYLIFYFILESITNNLIISINKIKKIILISCFLIATIITPPDIISQIIVGTCLLLFNELTLILVILKKNLKIIKT